MSMTISFNDKDSFDAATTANKFMGFDPGTINLVFPMSCYFVNSSINFNLELACFEVGQIELIICLGICHNINTLTFVVS